MNERHKLERATNTKYTDPEISDDMRRINTRFGIAHSVSSIINLAVVGGIIMHAMTLGVSHNNTILGCFLVLTVLKDLLERLTL